MGGPEKRLLEHRPVVAEHRGERRHPACDQLLVLDQQDEGVDVESGQ